MSNKVDKRIDHILPGQTLGVKVTKTKRYPDGDVNGAILKWKRMVKDAGVLDEVKDRQEFKKKSIVKRDQLSKAKYIQKIQRENNF